MAEKVKVSREVADVLERTIEVFEGDKASIIHNYVIGGCGGFWKKSFGVMKHLSSDDLFKALYVGYEVEKTPEEKVIYNLESVLDGMKFTNAEYGAYTDGALMVLNAYGIKIEGINK